MTENNGKQLTRLCSKVNKLKYQYVLSPVSRLTWSLNLQLPLRKQKSVLAKIATGCTTGLTNQLVIWENGFSHTRGCFSSLDLLPNNSGRVLREGEEFGRGPSVPELCLKQRHVLPKGCQPARSPALCNSISPHSHPLGGFLERKG